MAMNTSVALGIMTGIIVLTLDMGASATESAARRASAERSLNHGFDEPVLAVLERAPGPDSETIVAALVRGFCRLRCTAEVSASPTGRTRVRVPTWTFDMSADANGISSESDGQEERARSIAKGRPAPPTDGELESLARTFIAKRLVDLVTVDRFEDLVPVSVARKNEAGTDGRGGVASRVVASRILLARRVNGVPVVGGGGTISLTVANDGAPLAFAYDWPRYVGRASTQMTLPVGDLLARLQQVVAFRSTGSTKGVAYPVLVPPGAASFPYDLSADTFLESFECGYVDSGDPFRAAGASVQPGCAFRAIQVLRVPSGGNARSGFAGAIPGGETFERDDRWAEAMVLGSQPLPSGPAGATADAP